MTINKKYQMDPALEIRKLSPRYVRELVQILETHELWKRLMSIIPKKLEQNNYICDITLENQHKYNSEHFKLIENASEKGKRTCTEILLDEWGTSGRIRPALGHLLYLLTKAKLFRAADYVAVTLLNQSKPERPSSGPEALIPVDLPKIPKQKDKKLEEIEKLLDEIDYPSSAMLIIRSNSEEAARHNAPTVIPQIIISPDVEEDTRKAPDFNLPLVIPQKERTGEISNDVSVSDMIKFSSGTVSTNSQSFSETDNNRPDISNLLESESNLPNFELMNNSISANLVNNSEESSSSPSENSYPNPAFSQLFSSETSQSNVLPVPAVEISENPESPCEPNIPNISALNNSIHIDNLPDISILNIKSESTASSGENSDNFIPDFEALRSSNTAEVPLQHMSELGVLPDSSILSPSKNPSVNISTRLLPMFTDQNSSDNSTKSRPCTSPLPVLSLNTLLPHFNYCDLETATNNFNKNAYKGTKETGRFLGSGAFGSVFLALGLFDRPVAVKKLILENVEFVNVDDTVTKQFCNEVEVLSKYKHENLLSLLGYSCDGCTYCLMYEYVPGGALKDRLQATENKLQWKERLSIAMGTAKAVCYLHTAFSSPLVHRDIKSSNILLDSTNKPKLCDFGLIKLLPSQNSNTATTVFGTSAYMAPEAFRGDISVKLDTFSFGVVLLELLTSLPPMDESREGSDLVTYIDDNCENNDITALLDKETGSWQEFDVNFADELFKIALKCLEEKKKRPDMVEVTSFLEELLNKFSN